MKIKTINKAFKLTKLKQKHGLWQDQVHLTPFWSEFMWLKEVDFLIVLIEWLHEWFEMMSIDFKTIFVVGIQ